MRLWRNCQRRLPCYTLSRTRLRILASRAPDCTGKQREPMRLLFSRLSTKIHLGFSISSSRDEVFGSSLFNRSHTATGACSLCGKKKTGLQWKGMHRYRGQTPFQESAAALCPSCRLGPGPHVTGRVSLRTTGVRPRRRYLICYRFYVCFSPSISSTISDPMKFARRQIDSCLHEA